MQQWLTGDPSLPAGQQQGHCRSCQPLHLWPLPAHAPVPVPVPVPVPAGDDGANHLVLEVLLLALLVGGHRPWWDNLRLWQL